MSTTEAPTTAATAEETSATETAEAGDETAAAAPAAETQAAEAQAADVPPTAPAPEPRMKAVYRDEVRSELQKQLGLPNVMQVPKLSKIVINIGVGAALTQRNLLDGAIDDLAKITGQRPAITRAKKSIAGFKLREGNAIGCRVTLRGNRMWEFYDRLVSLAIPRIRDFRGLSPRSFDGHGNYTFGLTEQLVFPEIDYDSINQIRGMDITLVTSATDNAGGLALLSALGFPFRDLERN